jgi:hypothetical protein
VKWLQWWALVTIVSVSALIGFKILTWSPVTPATVRSSGSGSFPTPTQDNRVETVIALTWPTPTRTPKPTTIPRPSETPLVYCFGNDEPDAGTSCNPEPPTPDVPPTHVVTVVPLTCSTVTTEFYNGIREFWPSSCTWDGPVPTPTPWWEGNYGW